MNLEGVRPKESIHLDLHLPEAPTISYTLSYNFWELRLNVKKQKLKKGDGQKNSGGSKKDTSLFTLLPGEVGDYEVFRAATNLSETRVYCPSDPGSVPTTQRKPAISWDVTPIRGP